MLSPALQSVSGAEGTAEPQVAARAVAAFSTRDQPSAAAMETVTGTGLKWLDLGLLTVSLAMVTLPEYLHQSVKDPAMFFALRLSIKNLVVLLACWGLWSILLNMAGVYESRRIVSWRNLVMRLYAALAACSLITLATLHFRSTGQGVVEPLFIFFAGSFALTGTSRLGLVSFDLLLRPHLRKPRRAIIVGVDARAQKLIQRRSRDRHFAYDIVGLVDPVYPSGLSVNGLPVLGDVRALEELLMQEHIDEVLVTLPVRSSYDTIRQVLELCEASGVRSQYLADLFPLSVAKRKEANGRSGEHVVLHMVHSDLRLAVKRAIDIFGAGVGLVLLAPVFLVIAVLIRWSSPGPVFFSQVRYGLNKRRFPMLKFRSMVPDAEKLQAQLEHLNETGGPVFKIRQDPRITPVGRILRKTSLDELPQLLNVLRGEMSLVGPRPLPMRDVSNFSHLALVRRFSVKPGMTGLWQVSGRSDTSFDGWIKLDLHYIDHWSLLMDARILWRTLPAVVRGSGAS